MPATLFGRMAMLLLVFVLASHALALTVMFELAPAHGPHDPHDHHGHPPQSVPPLGIAFDIGVRLSALTLAAWIAAGWLSRPIKRLATAAHELGQTVNRRTAHTPGSPFLPIPEEGPAECREATRVFNQMQARIQQQLDERDRFVAAVSHDLRTPLTRLRLRAEGLPDAAEQRHFRRDIAEMDEMISATLDHLRGAALAEASVRLDVQALAVSLADDHQACGHDVGTHGSAAPLQVQPSALRRCIGNLVDNAVRYGGSARIHLVDSPSLLRIEVRDRGPGIAEAELGKVLAPFYRIEGSRNRRHGGVGLGLSIAHDLAGQLGATLTLRNGTERGLVAALEFPRN